GLRHAAELLRQFQQADLGPNHFLLILRHGGLPSSRRRLRGSLAYGSLPSQSAMMPTTSLRMSDQIQTFPANATFPRSGCTQRSCASKLHRSEPMSITQRCRSHQLAQGRAGLAGGRLPALIRRRPHHQTIESLCDLDLTRQPRIRAHVEGKVELVLLLFAPRAGLLEPSFVHIDHAGRATACSSAFSHDAGHAPFERALHYRRADIRFDRMRGSIVLNVGDLWHAVGLSCPPLRLRHYIAY